MNSPPAIVFVLTEDSHLMPVPFHSGRLTELILNIKEDTQWKIFGKLRYIS